MKQSVKKMILNLIMAGGVILLLSVALAARDQQAAKTAYAELAARRQAQAAATQAVAPPHTAPQQPVSPGILPPQSSEPTPASSTDAFQWKKNPNAQWLEINPDFLGWISVPGTNIDYPYVRSQDNEDYLTLDFDREKSKSGTIFMDYRNLGGFKDPHLMLYGHNMKNGTMFHDLVKYHDPAFLKANSEIVISDLYQTRTYRIFSVYEISATDYTLPTRFGRDEDQAYQEYLESLARRSMHPVQALVSPDQTLLTLVTCSYGVDNGRTILHAMEITE